MFFVENKKEANLTSANSPSIQLATSSRMPGLTSVCDGNPPVSIDVRSCFISRLMRVRRTRSFLKMFGSLWALILWWLVEE